jgi:hypothetical protein
MALFPLGLSDNQVGKERFRSEEGKEAGGVAQVVKYLLSKGRVLSSNSSPQKQKKARNAKNR